MYKMPSSQMSIFDFVLPFAGELNAQNRWVKLSEIIPWEQIEADYAKLFPSKKGNVAKPARMALGSLIIQNKCGYSDRELVQQITENPYLQYFIGLREYQIKEVFSPEALVKFRKRFNEKRLSRINEMILHSEAQQKAGILQEESELSNDDKNSAAVQEETPTSNSGVLILDATCTPADITFPTDTKLLNEAREKLEEIIDCVHIASGKESKRPRTYRRKARRHYLSFSKSRKPGRKVIRRTISKQLQYIKRSYRYALSMVAKFEEYKGFVPLTRRHQELLKTIGTVFEQQQLMYQSKSHSISDRIVNLYQSHVCPIVRGKAGMSVEFGAKVAISLENGMSRMEKLSWDAFNESETLIESTERYFVRNRCYPEVILADKIYRNRKNISFCKEHGIRLSGPKLGRPSKKASMQKIELTMERNDAAARNAVEGKFGEGKRKYGLSRIMAHLKQTAECVICMQFLVMNLERKLRVLFVLIFELMFFCKKDDYEVVRT